MNTYLIREDALLEASRLQRLVLATWENPMTPYTLKAFGRPRGSADRNADIELQIDVPLDADPFTIASRELMVRGLDAELIDMKQMETDR